MLSNCLLARILLSSCPMVPRIQGDVHRLLYGAPESGLSPCNVRLGVAPVYKVEDLGPMGRGVHGQRCAGRGLPKRASSTKRQRKAWYIREFPFAVDERSTGLFEVLE
jgi:hypothetical protein